MIYFCVACSWSTILVWDKHVETNFTLFFQALIAAAGVDQLNYCVSTSYFLSYSMSLDELTLSSGSSAQDVIELLKKF